MSLDSMIMFLWSIIKRGNLMRKLFLVIAVFLFSVSLNAQDLKVPVIVKDAFKKLYPKATNIQWDKEGKNEFEVNFKNENDKISVVFDKGGNLLETETEIEVNNLPEKVLQYVKEKYSDHKITEAAKIVDGKGKTTFEAQITKGKSKKDLIFTEDGQLLKK